MRNIYVIQSYLILGLCESISAEIQNAVRYLESDILVEGIRWTSMIWLTKIYIFINVMVNLNLVKIQKKKKKNSATIRLDLYQIASHESKLFYVFYKTITQFFFSFLKNFKSRR